MITPPDSHDSIIGASDHAPYDVRASGVFSLDDGISDVFAVKDGGELRAPLMAATMTIASYKIVNVQHHQLSCYSDKVCIKIQQSTIKAGNTCVELSCCAGEPNINIHHCTNRLG